VKLTADDFVAFYELVRGVEPFPWQAGLVERVLGEGRWPDLVDVPTGLGKTSMLDAALFVAAATADVPGPGRVGRRRCLFVVDRRIVVDDAYRHAAQLADRVAAAERDGEGGVVGAVAAGLRRLAPGAGGEVLAVTRMRGGVTWDQAWLERPDQPGVVIGTVDQVGSRFLFRGYGVSDRRRPIDAALVGTDALLLLDEAHLATALTTTLAAAAARDRLGLPLPGLDVVRLSAVPAGRRRALGPRRGRAAAAGAQGAAAGRHHQRAMRRRDGPARADHGGRTGGGRGGWRVGAGGARRGEHGGPGPGGARAAGAAPGQGAAAAWAVG
jgi:CRISPR-associated endonuclease/helicase Cas3